MGPLKDTAGALTLPKVKISARVKVCLAVSTGPNTVELSVSECKKKKEDK
jgi:hypothetical protein